jgi:hypothetical protein
MRRYTGLIGLRLKVAPNGAADHTQKNGAFNQFEDVREAGTTLPNVGALTVVRAWLQLRRSVGPDGIRVGSLSARSFLRSRSQRYGGVYRQNLLPLRHRDATEHGNPNSSISFVLKIFDKRQSASPALDGQ